MNDFNKGKHKKGNDIYSCYFECRSEFCPFAIKMHQRYNTMKKCATHAKLTVQNCLHVAFMTSATVVTCHSSRHISLALKSTTKPSVLDTPRHFEGHVINFLQSSFQILSVFMISFRAQNGLFNFSLTSCNQQRIFDFNSQDKIFLSRLSRLEVTHVPISFFFLNSTMSSILIDTHIKLKNL